MRTPTLTNMKAKETVMLIHDTIAFHNCAELVPAPRGGLALARLPVAIIPALSRLGQHVAWAPDGIELRFTGARDWLCLTLEARSALFYADAAYAEVFYGDLPVTSVTIPDGAVRTLRLMAPDSLAQLAPSAWAHRQFASDLWRVRLSGAGVIFHGLESAGAVIRPPNADETPAVRWLAYGSSITNCTPGYVHHAARLLGVDVANKGMSGSCACEPEVASYLAACDWDIATLELGVNLRGTPTPEFERRARHMVGTLRAAKPTYPIVLITIFPNGDDHLRTPNCMSQANREYRDVLRRIHAEAGDTNLHLVEGDRVLDAFFGLSADLIHPSPEGNFRMGANLAAILHPIIADMPQTLT